MDMGKLKNLIFTGILLAAGLVRLWGLEWSPPSLNWDEAAIGYNAYSLWKTGKDEYGYFLPFSLRSFDDYKPPLYAYLTAPVVGIWGLTGANTRLVSALAGIISVIWIYKITKELTGEDGTALAAMALTAAAPWGIIFSRGAFEANLALALTLGGIYFLVCAEEKRGRFIPGILLFGLAAVSYHSAKIYLPLALVWVILRLGRESLHPKWILAMVLAAAPVFYTSMFGAGLSRLSTTSIMKIWQADRSIYNFAAAVTDRYFSYFSPANLFVRGSNEPNQSISGYAMYYPLEFILWAVGMATVFSKNARHNTFLKYWIVAAPIPAVITWSWFSPVRVLPLMAAFSVTGAIGAGRILGGIMNNSARMAAGAVMAGMLIIYAAGFFMTARFYVPYVEFGKWQWGFRETIQAIKSAVDKYDRVIWETPQAQPHIFTLFYSAYPPAVYHTQVKTDGSNKDFGKYEFRKIYWPTDRNMKNTLFIGSVYSLPENDLKRDGVEIISEIYDPQENLVYRIAGTGKQEIRQ